MYKPAVADRGDDSQGVVLLLDEIDKADTTVTQALWQAVTLGNSSRFKGDKLPVETVNWHDIQDFIAWLNQRYPKLQSRLPWEAEWEYACRAGSQTSFNFEGNLTTDKVNYNYSYSPYWGKETTEIKSYPCNAWGLYDMHGNVWEWCQDSWQRHLGEEAVCDPWLEQQPLGSDSCRVARGGSWFSNFPEVRSASRERYTPDRRNSYIGFRLALSYVELQPGQGSGT